MNSLEIIRIRIKLMTLSILNLKLSVKKEDPTNEKYLNLKSVKSNSDTKKTSRSVYFSSKSSKCNLVDRTCSNGPKNYLAWSLSKSLTECSNLKTQFTRLWYRLAMSDCSNWRAGRRTKAYEKVSLTWTFRTSTSTGSLMFCWFCYASSTNTSLSRNHIDSMMIFSSREMNISNVCMRTVNFCFWDRTIERRAAESRSRTEDSSFPYAVTGWRKEWQQHLILTE